MNSATIHDQQLHTTLWLFIHACVFQSSTITLLVGLSCWMEMRVWVRSYGVVCGCWLWIVAEFRYYSYDICHWCCIPHPLAYSERPTSLWICRMPTLWYLPIPSLPTPLPNSSCNIMADTINIYKISHKLFHQIISSYHQIITIFLYNTQPTTYCCFHSYIFCIPYEVIGIIYIYI